MVTNPGARSGRRSDGARVTPGAASRPALDPWSQIAGGMAIHAVTPRPEVGLTPNVVIHTQDKLQVRYYAPAPQSQPSSIGGTPSDAPRHPIVLVPSLINRAYILDLEPGRSLCAALAGMGHAVYLVDWGVPGPEDADEGVGYVVDELLPRAIDRAVRHCARSHAGGTPANPAGALVLGYCMGGVVAAVCLARMAAGRPGPAGAPGGASTAIAGFIALNTPVSFAHAGRFRDLVAPEHLDVDRDLPRLFDADGLVPVNVMKPAFNLLDPVGSITKYRAVHAAAEDRDALARVLARERWLEENVPMPGRFAREFIAATYQKDQLLTGEWVLDGLGIDLRQITAPTLIVSCSGDFICPPEAATPLAAALGSTDVETHTLKCGHIGVVVGSEGPRTFYPLVDRWARRVGGVPGRTP